MRNTIVLEVNDVFLTDFDSKLSAPLLIESREGGVRILFSDIDELIEYQKSLQLDQDQTDKPTRQNDVKSKLNLSLNQALRDHQIVLDSIKKFADTLFSFVFGADAHRQDKLVIFDNLVAGIRETTNSWELKESIKEATYELNIPDFDHKLTFYDFAHNQVDFNYENIRNRLIKDLLILKLGLN